jgi:hypothetical protein
MINTNFRFERDPFEVYQFSQPYSHRKESSSSFFSILGIILAIIGIVVVIILRKTIWKLITKYDYPFLNKSDVAETEVI